MYARELEDVINIQLSKPEIILIYGARQTGKSTLLELLATKTEKLKILNCENPLVADILTSMNPEKIGLLFDNNEVIGLDEAQVVPEIGRILKFIFDNKDFKVQIIATGSSSFDLSNSAGEPLTGRNITFRLYPLSLSELRSEKGWLKTIELLDQWLIYGTYPATIDLQPQQKQNKLISITGDYLFKDIFKFERLRNPLLLRKLLKALALQIGSIVSIQELSQLTGVSSITVERYLDLLEKSFVIFSLHSFSSNLRNELKKSRKYYFYDNGIRNAVINNFAMPAERTDIGALWENYCIAEIVKSMEYKQVKSNLYFWRTYDGSELDLVSEYNGQLSTYEFKWSIRKTARLPVGFANKYAVNSFQLINPENLHFLLNPGSQM